LRSVALLEVLAAVPVAAVGLRSTSVPTSFLPAILSGRALGPFGRPIAWRVSHRDRAGGGRVHSRSRIA
jgi:hypothetical protein